MPELEYPNKSRYPVWGSEPFTGTDGSGCPEYQQHEKAGDFESMHVINATPISMVAPEDTSADPISKVTKRRNMEEMAKRPDWLPEDWRIDLRIRSSGASAGLIDRYFFDPSGRKFRSKQEVLNFLETGKRKRNADDVPSGSKTPKKPSSAKKKKSKAFEVDVAYPTHQMF